MKRRMMMKMIMMFININEDTCVMMMIYRGAR